MIAMVGKRNVYFVFHFRKSNKNLIIFLISDLFLCLISVLNLLKKRDLQKVVQKFKKGQITTNFTSVS